MAKPTTKKLLTDSAESTGSFPVPFSLDEFRNDILEVFLLYVRTISWMTNEKTAWAITGAPELGPNYSALMDPDSSASDLGLTYEHIRTTRFADAMEHLYEYAYHGRLDVSAENMEYESLYMWISDIVADANGGHVAHQWDSYGWFVDGATRCYMVAELANARVMLESGGYFSYFNVKEDAVGYDALTVRQMSLLAGMEEMSIRAAANPKRANPLKTHSEGKATRVSPEVAKAWLKSKGRYVPIARYSSAGEIDLAKRRFTVPVNLMSALDARYELLALRDGAEHLDATLAVAGIQGGRCLQLDEGHLINEAVMRAVATALELPPDLLALRAREAVTHQQLYRIEKQLREITQPESKPNP